MLFRSGRSAVETGLVMLPIAFGLVMGSGLSHKLNLKLGTPRQLTAALIVVALTLATVPFWQPRSEASFLRFKAMPTSIFFPKISIRA